MGNPTYTRSANATIVLMRIGSGGWAADDVHLTIGRGSGSRSDWIGRAEFRIPESDWPARGRMVRALLSVRKANTSAHGDFTGSSPRMWVKRLSEKPGFSVPSTNDGYYTQQGSGDKYPGSNTAGDAVEFAVSGSETHDVTAQVEAMLPPRIKKRNGSDGGNALYGYWQIRSSDEGNAAKSFILSKEITLSVEIKTAVTPDPPLIVEVIGAQEGTSGPTVVGSTDGRTLEVRFAFRGAPGDYPAKARLDLYGVGAIDAAVTPFIAGTDWVAPRPAGGAGQYSIRLTGLPYRVAGRYRVNTISQKGEQGDPSSLDGDEAWVQMAVIPGPPLGIVFQPLTDGPHILASLDSPNPGDYITGMEVEATLLPDGTLGWASGMVDIGGTTRRGDLIWVGTALGPGQRISYRVRLRNQDRVWGRWSAPATVTVREAQAVTFSPASGRLTSTTPTITLSFPLADGARLRLLDLTADNIVLWDSGATVLVNQTSYGFAVPAGKLAYGQSFRAVGSYVPDGGLTTYLAESQPVTYTVAKLPTTVLSVPAAYLRRVGVTDVVWQRTVADPDGAAIAAIDQEIRTAATPQGSGTQVTRWYDPTAAVLTTVPSGSVAFETAVDSRARATNDITALATTTLNGALSVGATGGTLTSATGFAVGQDIVIASAVSGATEVRPIATLVGTVVTWIERLGNAHASGQAVTARVFGPWSPWLTISALRRPDVDLISPVDGATLADPTQVLDWSVTGYGGRTQASAVATLYTAASGVLVSLPVAGVTSVADIPGYLLDTAASYPWDVTVTDSMGMVTTSARRTFTTAFAEPLPITVLSAEADRVAGAVVLTWNEGAEPYVDHYEVTWIADDGSPVRIDRGPESLLDGAKPFTGGMLTHIGARLGDNVYYVAVSNGWRASDPVSTSTTLGRPDFRSWVAVDGLGNAYGSVVTSGTMPHAPMAERFQPPGGQPRQVTWGNEPRRWTMQVHLIPAEDGEMVPVLRRWQGSGIPVWLKAPGPYLLDPVWATLQSFTSTLAPNGDMTIDTEWAELGDPVHAILPATVAALSLSVGNIYVTSDTLDFGTLGAGT